jgi:hypothetical protein
MSGCVVGDEALRWISGHARHNRIRKTIVGKEKMFLIHQIS